ncbi:MAG: MFS transporter [Candidatus Eisenbacteria bacterium]|nr:MFS transporter [Candidatus Eisenbacteria bacterium]
MTVRAPLAGLPYPRWRVFPPIALGVVMAALDAMVVNIALPTLQRRFAVPFTTIEWVVLAYTVTITGLMLSAGRLADLRGRRGVYATGLVLFTLASLLCGLSPSVHVLIAARVLQGVGGALVSANGSALLVSAFPLEERGRALGAFGAMVGVGLALGAPLGGLMIAHGSWRWIFLVNAPLGALALALLFARVPADRPAPAAPPLDLVAAALWCGALASLMLALSRGPESGWAATAVVGLFIAAGLLLVLFSAAEARSSHPMLPLKILFGPLGAAVSLTLIGQAVTVSVGLQVPLYLEEVLGYDAQRTGLWVAILPLAALLLAPAAGQLADRFGARLLTAIGMGATAAGLAVLAGLRTTMAWPLPVGLLLVGAGQGLFSVPNASALLSLVPHEQLGIASGLQGTTRNLGLSGGAAFVGAALASRYLAHAGRVLEGGSTPVDRIAFVAASHDAFVALTVIGLLGTLLAAMPRGRAVAAS